MSSQGFQRHSGRSEDFLFRPAPGSPGYLTPDHLPDGPPEVDDVDQAPSDTWERIRRAASH